MYGMVPNSIRGIRTLHHTCSRLVSYKRVSRLPPATMKLHVRRCTAKSNLLKALKSYSNSNSENANKDGLNNVGKLENRASVSKVETELLTAESNLDENGSGLLMLNNIRNQTNVTPEKRVELVEDLFEMLKSRNIAKTEEHYLGFLKCYSGSKCCLNLDNLLLEMENDGVELSVTLQQSISRCLSQNGQYKELLKLINKLTESGVEVNESVYEELVYSHAASGNISEAVKQYKQMVKDNASKERHLQMCLLRGIIHNGIENNVKEKLTEFVVLGYKLSFDELYSVYEEILLHQHLHLIPLVTQAVGVESLLQNLPNLLTKLINKGNVDNAFDLLHNVSKNTDEFAMEIPVNVYKGFIDALIARNHPLDDVINKCKELRKLEECQYVMEHLLHSCLVSNKFSESLEVIYAMAESGATIEPHYFWPLLIEAHKRFEVEENIQWMMHSLEEGIGSIIFVSPMAPLDRPYLNRVCYVVKAMFDVGIYPNSETLLNYVYPHLNPFFMFKYIRLMAPSSRIFQFFQEVFIIHSLKNGYFKQCNYLLQRRPLGQHISYYFLEKPFIKAFKERKPNAALINILKMTDAVDPYLVLSELWSDGNEHQLRIVLEQFISMKATGKHRHVAETIINKPNLPEDIANGIRDFISLSEAKKRSGMRSADSEIEKESMYECMEIIDDMEIHMEELKAKNMNAIGQVFRLLKYFMKTGFYNRALKMREELFKITGHDVELSPSYIACLCKLSEYEKDDEQAMRYYRMVREEYPDFLFDVPKSVGLCILFIRTGAFDVLMDLLERMPKWHGNILMIQHKMKTVLNETATLADPEKTKMVFDKLLEKNMIIVTNQTLEAFVRTYQEMENCEGAVEEFKRLIGQYGKVPAAMDLLWYLIERRKFEKMEEVLRITMENSEDGSIFVIIMLKLLACLGDENVFRKYLGIYGIGLDDSRFPNVLSWQAFGGSIDRRMTAFKTFLKVAAPSDRLLHVYADLAVEHVCFDKEEAAVQQLRCFLEEMGIVGKYQRKLNNVTALLKAVSSTANRSLFRPMEDLPSLSGELVE